MKILTAAQMREIDRLTIEELGLPSLTLMENAGVQFVLALERRFPNLREHRVTILCGKGNNGGDGFVIARQLWMRGVSPRVVLLADPASLAADAAVNFNYLTRIGLEMWVARTFDDWLRLKPDLLNSTLLVDAILGTGLAKPLEGFYLEIVSDLNSGFPPVPVISVDMPTGLPSDTGDYIGESVRAAMTVTFTAPKVSHVFPPNSGYVGDLVVASIGAPPELVEQGAGLFLNLHEPSDVAPVLTPRLRDAHKGDFGRILIVAGGRGKTGAAALAGQAALRSGGGLVTVATASSAVPVVAASLAELMTEPLPETDTGAISARAFDYGVFGKVAAEKDIVAIGPGLSTHPDTVDFIRRVVRDFRMPMVIDADGLNALAGATELLDGRERLIVVTPHPGEMARLLGVSTADVQARRVETARALATAHHIYVVLKGHRTLVAEPEGQVHVSPTGNPGMASAGMGDVLTGIIPSFLAQFSGRAPGAVISAAVYLHGLAGDLAAAELGEMPITAGDIIRCFPQALRRVQEQAAA
jgi:NAD(P)H-hydrate epimerase